MSVILDAARQALPGLEWHHEGVAAVWAYPDAGGGRVGINGRNDDYYAFLRDRGETCKSAEAAAQWLRSQVTARRDALDAALGESDRGTNAEKLKALAGLVKEWPVTWHAYECAGMFYDAEWHGCDCGANDARAEARRLCGVL